MDRSVQSLLLHFGVALPSPLEGPFVIPGSHASYARHFSGPVWLAYDQAFCEHKAATQLTDWS